MNQFEDKEGSSVQPAYVSDDDDEMQMWDAKWKRNIPRTGEFGLDIDCFSALFSNTLNFCGTSFFEF